MLMPFHSGSRVRVGSGVGSGVGSEVGVGAWVGSGADLLSDFESANQVHLHSVANTHSPGVRGRVKKGQGQG